MTIIVKLKFGVGNEVQYHTLEKGSNVIGRGNPSFITDSKISRKHAEIIVSQTNITYIQMGQNRGLLTRDNGSPVNSLASSSSSSTANETIAGSPPSSIAPTKQQQFKLVKGTTTILKHNDKIQLCDGDVNPLVVIFEEDQIQPMETLEEEMATQLDPDTDVEEDEKEDNTDSSDENNNIDDSRVKRIRDSDEDTQQQINDNNNNDQQHNEQDTQDGNRLKKIKYKHLKPDLNTTTALNTINNNNTLARSNMTTTTTTTTTSNNTPVQVQDDLRINLSEDDLVYVRKLGNGSCGEVAQYEWRGTQVAVKTIYRSLIHKDKTGEFEKETAILRCLRHPNVVLFMGTCMVKGNLAIITEYLNKGSLRDVLNTKKSLPWNTKIKICMDVAQGMNYLHSYNPKIIHRDLKSLNLLVDNNFNVKVSDFGLSRFSTGSEAKTFCGTLSWIAPEVFTRSGYSTKADVFSFGVVLWEILTHQQPSGSIASTTLGHPEIPADCPIPYAQLIKDCCARLPENRPNFSQIIQRLKSMFVINDSKDQSDSVDNGNNNHHDQKLMPPPQQQTPTSQQLIKQHIHEWKIEADQITDIVFVKKEEKYTLFSGVYKSKQVLLKTFQQSTIDFEKKELDILASIKSPLVLQFLGVVYNNEEYAIVSEFSSQTTLLQYFQMENPTNPFSWNQTIDIAIQLVKSLNLLHHFKPQIFHRGISSECFLYDEKTNSIQITDFGLSRFNIHENLLSLGQIKGNFVYSPPELFLSKKYNSKSDIYSLSIVLWELFQRCITGSYQTPFSHLKLDYDFQVIHQAAKFNKRPLVEEAKLPPQLFKLLTMCWDSEPLNRPDLDKVLNILTEFKNSIVKQQ